MRIFLQAFADELTKEAGLGVKAVKGLGRLGMTRHGLPLLISVPGIAIGTVAAAKRGYKKGRALGQEAKYLPTGYNKVTRKAEPSQAAFIRYGKLFGRASDKEVARLTRDYKEKAFRG